MCGRNEGNVKVIIPKVKVKDCDEHTMRDIQKGDYLAVEVNIDLLFQQHFPVFKYKYH